MSATEVKRRGRKACVEQHTALLGLGNRSPSHIGHPWKNGWLLGFDSSLTVLNVTQELGRWLSTYSVCSPSLCAGDQSLIPSPIWQYKLVTGEGPSPGEAETRGSLKSLASPSRKINERLCIKKQSGWLWGWSRGWPLTFACTKHKCAPLQTLISLPKVKRK